MSFRTSEAANLASPWALAEPLVSWPLRARRQRSRHGVADALRIREVYGHLLTIAATPLDQIILASIQCRCLVTIQLDRYLTEARPHKQLAQLSVGIEAESMLREGVPRH